MSPHNRPLRLHLPLGALPAAGIASLLIMLGACGSTDPNVTIEPDIVACAGASCWDCADVEIQNGTRTVCEKTMTGEVPDSYDCGKDDDMDACPPESTLDAGIGGAPRSAPDAGTSTDASATPSGGYQCKKGDGTVRCEGPPKCAPNAQPSPCGECVTDACSACTCPDDADDDDQGKGKGKDKKDKKDKDKDKEDNDKD